MTEGPWFQGPFCLCGCRLRNEVGMERPRWPTTVRAGQGVVEYGLLVMSISVLVLGLFLLLGDQFGSIFSNVTSSI